MEIYGRYRLEQKMVTLKEDPVQRQILRIVIKYEIQSLLQRLADLGEESVVVMASLVDGSHSVLASDHGEKFLHNQVVSLFKDHFVRYLSTGTTDSESSGHEAIEVSVEEPETFMHMKKHQIEQYNRRRDKEDKSIDEKVSRLVQNILKEGKQKELINKRQSGFSPFPSRRKRRNSYQDRRGDVSGSDSCSSAKKKSIASLFPSLSGNATPVTSAYGHAIDHEVSSHSIALSEDEFVTVKIEPVDDDEYGVISENVNNEKGSQDSDSVNSDYSNKDCGKDSSNAGECVKRNNMVRPGHVSDGQLRNASSEMGDGSDKATNKNENEVELPYVEEFYQPKRVSSIDDDVKIVFDEKTMQDFPRVTSCYKQSRKKSNTFNLVLNGYSYIKDKQGKAGTLYWKCGRGGCKGRVIQRGEELIISQVHIHEPPSEEHIQVHESANG